MFLCENTIYSQSRMEDVLTHELIHAYDNCRVKYDPDSVKMLACTEVFSFSITVSFVVVIQLLFINI